MPLQPRRCSFFFFNDTATTEIYTLSLHDALPICGHRAAGGHSFALSDPHGRPAGDGHQHRSEEHTSELQSPCNLVCRLLLEKKKKQRPTLLALLPAPDISSHLCQATATGARSHIL